MPRKNVARCTTSVFGFRATFKALLNGYAKKNGIKGFARVILDSHVQKHFCERKKSKVGANLKKILIFIIIINVLREFIRECANITYYL